VEIRNDFALVVGQESCYGKAGTRRFAFFVFVFFFVIFARLPLDAREWPGTSFFWLIQ